MEKDYWEHFYHQADIGIRGISPNREDAFAQAALALIAVITPPEMVKPLLEVDIHCQEEDDDYLFYAWINAIIYEIATRKMLFTRFRVQISPAGELTARAWGEPIDPSRHQPTVEVKGATFTCLKVEQDPTGLWSAQCVVDV